MLLSEGETGFLRYLPLYFNRFCRRVFSWKKKKKTIGFNIIKSDPTDGHGGFGAGSLSLDNISPVFVDVEEKEAFVDIGAMHARSVVEKGIKFLPNKDEVPNGKPYWLVWVTIDRKEEVLITRV